MTTPVPPHLVNSLTEALEKLETEYKLVSMTYPVNIWVPRSFMEKQYVDWPKWKMIERPLTIRLVPLPVEEWTGERWTFERNHLSLSVAMGLDELSLRLRVNDVIMDPLYMIPEVRSALQ